MLKKLDEEGLKWWIDIRLGRANRFRETFHGNESEARVYYRKCCIELEVTPGELYTISSCIDEYLVHRKTHDSETTYKERKRILKGPVCKHFGHLNPDSIIKKMIGTYQDARIAEIVDNPGVMTKKNNLYKHGHGTGKRMVNLEMIYLSAYVDWMVEESYCQHSLPKWKQFTLPSRKPKNKPLEVVETVIANMEPFWRCFWVVVFECGLRKEEITALTWSGVLWASGVVHVVGKLGKERDVPMNDKVRVALNWHAGGKVLVPDRLVFPSPAFREDHELKDVRKSIVRACKRASLTEHITPHMFRHSIATIMHDNGVDIAVIQAFLGHTDINTTKIYMGASTRRVREAVEWRS